VSPHAHHQVATGRWRMSAQTGLKASCREHQRAATPAAMMHRLYLEAGLMRRQQQPHLESAAATANVHALVVRAPTRCRTAPVSPAQSNAGLAHVHVKICCPLLHSTALASPGQMCGAFCSKWRRAKPCWQRMAFTVSPLAACAFCIDWRWSHRSQSAQQGGASR
jgi:hypothetical protein